MKIRFAIIVFCLLVSALSIRASHLPTRLTGSTSQGYAGLWKKVDSLSNLGQPKSALDLVGRIYNQAKKEKNDPQFIKSIIYKIKLQADFREDALPLAVRDLKTEIAGAGEPARQILNSILAEVYWKYYQNNRHRFADRTQVVNNKSDSIQTWDLNTLMLAIINTYRFSTANEALLKSLPVKTFSPILEVPGQQKDAEDKFRPTLYDFLAWRILEYAMSNPGARQQPVDEFRIDRAEYFLQAGQFSHLQILPPKDTTSLPYIVVRLLQDLAAFHLSDKDPRALIDEEITRFAILREKSILETKDSLYLDALTILEKAYSSSPFSTNVSFRIAQFLQEQGAKYNPLISDDHRWDVKSALEFCENAIKRFPESDGAKNCRILLEEIKQPSLSVNTESAVVPLKPFPGLIAYINVPVVYFRLVEADPETNQEKVSGMTREEQISYYSNLPVLKAWSVNLPSDGDYQSHKTEVKIPELPSGYYLILCSSDKNFKGSKQAITWTEFFSTQLSYFSQKNDNDGLDFYVLDRETGKPLKNVSVEAFQKNYNYQNRRYESRKTGDYTSDTQGFFSVPALEKGSNAANCYLRLRQKTDFYITENFFRYTPNDRVEKPFLSTSFFTDRAIYRPGQTIYYKGILLEKTGDKSVLKPGAPTTVTFFDVNYQKIAEQNFTTNEYGTFHGSFVAPVGLLLGQMTISNGSGSAYVRVEEYKRPTFEVFFNPLEGNYRLNDSIEVTGRAVAFAGNNIDGAKVTFRVVRTCRFPYRDCWWCPFPVSREVEITNGTTVTRDDGTFSFRFRAVPDQLLDKSQKPVFDYKLFADVTDITAETQSAEEVVSVGYSSLLIRMDIPQKMNLEKDTVFKLSATNLNGRKTPAVVTVLIQRLHQPDRAFRGRKWDRPDIAVLSKDEFHNLFPNDVFMDEDDPAKWIAEETVIQEEMNSGTDSLLHISRIPGSHLLRPGSYLVTLKAKDPSGEVVQSVSTITAFDPSSKEVPVNVINWFVPLDISGEPGDKARFLVGSKEEDVNLIYEIRVKDSLCSRQSLKISNNQLLVEVPIKEEYRGNFSVNLIFVRHNRVFQNSQVITVPYTNKKLDIVFSTFRSKLYPGTEEEWKINITNAMKKGVEAEFLTTMYDESLDAFAANSWNFSVFKSSYANGGWDTDGSFNLNGSTSYPIVPVLQDYRFPKYEELNWFGFGYFRQYRNGRNLKMGLVDNAMTMDDKASPSAAGKSEKTPQAVEEFVEQSAGEKGIGPESTKELPEKPLSGIQVRRDFRETAFFYPSLVTDSAGSLAIKFTVPESLTRWKLLGFALTKDLDYGLTEKELITQKDLMVFPNSPRFVRQGDTVIFSAKVTNLSNRSLSVDLLLEIFDPVTSKPLNLIVPAPRDPASKGGNSANSAFTLPLGQSISHQWTLVIPVDPSCQILQYRITARAGNFSDGEEKTIPVLTNRMLVTESLPLPVNGKGTFDFHFDKLIQSQPGKTLKNYRLTLEFASNPAWYAVQALPTLDDPKFPNADNIFDAFYANSIASFIANSNPKIRQVFEAWKSLTPDALLSNLEKNQQLKSALLQETPWVMEAKDESQRKQRIALLFDLNTMANRLEQNMNKLQKLQTANGAWPWFEGMQESRYITQSIVTGLGHLDHLGAKNIREDKKTWNMLAIAVKYLDGEMVKDYEWIKKHYPDKMDENHLGAFQIQYLYARSYFLKEVPVSSTANLKTADEAFEYYRKQAEKYWMKNDLCLQGMIGLALNRMGNKEVPRLILKSFSEKALHSPEMGMYWAYTNGYEWYQAPVESQALMIEAFDEIVSDQKSVEEMKIWLLKQKQTQDWKTGKATVEACYALLLRGTDLLASTPEVRISLGKTQIDPKQLQDSKVEAGTGYFQISWDGKEISPEMGKITITKSDEGIAWGAVYWQYFEDLDKITRHQTPLKIEKKLFVETNTASGPVLKEIATSLNGEAYKGNLNELRTGDKVKVRIVLSVDRNLEYVHMKDLRAAGFEPVIFSSGNGNGSLSGYRYQGGLGYYQSTTDAATNFFFDYLPRGTWVFEYPLRVNAAGDYSNGVTTIQCMYAPEFGAHSEGIRVSIK